MNTEVAKNTTFEERMFEEMREKMGSLLTDTELKQILEKAIDKAFFSSRNNPSSSYNAQPLEPLFVELMREELKPLIQKGAEQWLSENQDKVGEILKQQLGESGAEMMANFFSQLIQGPMLDFSFQIRERLGANNIQI